MDLSLLLVKNSVAATLAYALCRIAITGGAKDVVLQCPLAMHMIPVMMVWLH
jgi:hypothetical protein